MEIGDLEYFERAAKVVRSVRPIDRYVNKNITDRLWRTTVIPTAEWIARNYKVSTSMPFAYSISHYPVKALIDSLFSYDRRVLTNHSMAVAMYMTLHGYVSKKYVFKEGVIEAAGHMTKAIANALSDSQIFKSELKRFNKDHNEIDYTIHRDWIMNSLSTNKELFENYFGSFREESFYDYITVWCPREGQSWIDWDTKASVKVNLDPTKIPAGFFLVGFDYSDGMGGYLRQAFRKDGYEYFNNTKTLGKAQTIWSI